MTDSLNAAFQRYGSKEATAAVGALALSVLGAIGVGGALLVASTLRVAGQEELATKIDSWIAEVGSAAQDLVNPATSILNPANWSSQEADIIQAVSDTAFTSQLDYASPFNPGLTLDDDGAVSNMPLINDAIKVIRTQMSSVPPNDLCEWLRDFYEQLQLLGPEETMSYGVLKQPLQARFFLAAVRLLIRTNCGPAGPGQSAY